MPEIPYITYRRKIYPICGRVSKLLDAVAETGSIPLACKNLRIRQRTAKRLLSSPPLATWILRRMKSAAERADFSVDDLFNFLIKVIKGKTKGVDPSRMRAAEIFAKATGIYSDAAVNKIESIQFTTGQPLQTESDSTPESIKSRAGIER